MSFRRTIIKIVLKIHIPARNSERNVMKRNHAIEAENIPTVKTPL